MEEVAYSRVRDVAIAAAHDAGELIREHVNRSKSVSLKTSATDLVTEVDKQAEAIIRTHINEAFPDHVILGEETVAPGPEASARALTEKRDAAHLWIIDPIDGTTNFVHGFPFFCVSIALAERGDLKFGVIYDPMKDEWFEAEKGNGATLNGEPLHVSEEGQLSESLLASGFAGIDRRSGRKVTHGLSALIPHVRNIRTAGSAALLLAYVAAGRLSGFWEMNLNAWDLAAGALLVTEAGGKVSDTIGRPYHLGVRHIVATNGLIHDRLVHVLKEADATGFA